MLKKYKPGDWVTIKGKNFSPKMEVLKYVPKKDGIFGVVNTDTYVECIWYENGTRKSAVFNQNKLIKLVDTGGFFKT